MLNEFIFTRYFQRREYIVTIQIIAIGTQTHPPVGEP